VKKLVERLQIDNPFYYSPIHGRRHYANVMAAGIELAAHFNLNPKLFKYFAYLHDSCRENEGYDPQHGPRAADYIDSIKDLIDLCQAERWMLQSACTLHTSAKPWDGYKYTLYEKACFDSDRSDIIRTGLAVDPKYLFTSKAKELYVTEERNYEYDMWAVVNA
jgi:uncharacterized protein